MEPDQLRLLLLAVLGLHLRLLLFLIWCCCYREREVYIFRVDQVISLNFCYMEMYYVKLFISLKAGEEIRTMH